MKKNLLVLSAALAAVSLMSGCATNLSGDVYTREQARVEQNVRYGVIEGIRPVVIEGTKTPVGALAGGALGGLAGSNLGRGNGSIAGAIVGAVAGGVGGNYLEEKMTRKQGVEFTVRVDGGRTISVVQEGDPNAFRIGDRVKVLSSGGTTRITF